MGVLSFGGQMFGRVLRSLPRSSFAALSTRSTIYRNVDRCVVCYPTTTTLYPRIQKRALASKKEEFSEFELTDVDSAGEEGDANDEDIPIHSEEYARVNLARYERALEMQQQAETFMREDNFDMASSLYSSCLGTLTAYLEFKYADAEPSVLNVQKAEMLTDPMVGLAFAQQCLGRLEEAEQSYVDAMEMMKTKGVTFDHDKHARCVLNYAELLCQKEKPLAAIDLIQSTMDKLPNKKSEIYASAMCNISIYYAILKRYEDALPHAKQGYELFCKALGKNNPYTESALQGYMRILRDNGKEEEADRLHEQWQSERRESELPSQEVMEQEISGQLSESLKHLSQKKTFDPQGLIVPPEVLEEQKKIFSQKYANADFGDQEFIDAIEPELKNLYDLVGKSKDFHRDMEKFKQDPEYAKETLSKGITTPILNLGIREYYQNKSDMPTNP